MAKSGGLRSLKALEFEKWEGVEPNSLSEVYAYGCMLCGVAINNKHRPFNFLWAF